MPRVATPCEGKPVGWPVEELPLLKVVVDYRCKQHMHGRERTVCMGLNELVTLPVAGAQEF